MDSRIRAAAGLHLRHRVDDKELVFATGAPPAQILLDALGATAGKLLLLVVIGAQLFCGMASVTANSRMIYAFSRDGALPFSRVCIPPARAHARRSRRCGRRRWVLVLGLPYLINVTAYAAVTSIAVIGLYIAYVIPTLLRLRKGEAFERGPWHLGRWSGDRRRLGGLGRRDHGPVHAAAGLAGHLGDLDYAPVGALVVLGFAATWWLASARHWFLNPDHARTVARVAARKDPPRTG